MDAHQPPSRPHIGHYRKRAKDLVKAHAAGDVSVLARIIRHHPHHLSSTMEAVRHARFQLADAQWVLAREHGFPSWAKFITSLTAAPTLPWLAVDAAVRSADVAALDRLLQAHPTLRERPAPGTLRDGQFQGDLISGDATSIIMRWHHFDSIEALHAYQEAYGHPESPVSRFERTADAVVDGDETALADLLRTDPALARARSVRRHRCTLLHYIAANGIESWRERTPRNAAAVVQLLLSAGADINAVAPVYSGGPSSDGSDTTLGLVVTSIFPLRAGVLEDLVELLLARGAVIDRDPEAYPLVNSCLANGRRAAAALLAEHGASLDIEGAAGLGRIDLVREWLDAAGEQSAATPSEQLARSFAWACEYGHTPVVALMLERGFPIGHRLTSRGETGLHWAAINAHLAIATLLRAHGASLETLDSSHGSTPLGWAIHAWRQPGLDTPRDRIYPMIAWLVAAGSVVEARWMEDEELRRDAHLVAALAGTPPPSG